MSEGICQRPDCRVTVLLKRGVSPLPDDTWQLSSRDDLPIKCPDDHIMDLRIADLRTLVGKDPVLILLELRDQLDDDFIYSVTQSQVY